MFTCDRRLMINSNYAIRLGLANIAIATDTNTTSRQHPAVVRDVRYVSCARITPEETGTNICFVCAIKWNLHDSYSVPMNTISSRYSQENTRSPAPTLGSEVGPQYYYWRIFAHMLVGPQRTSMCSGLLFSRFEGVNDGQR